jgi:DNA-binding IclR family transcriptional regulator
MIKSCSGQVILAFSSTQRADQIIAAVQEEQGSSINETDLGDRLAVIRQQGFDSRQSPITHGVTDISFPVFGFDSNVVAALTIPFLELIDGSQKVGLTDAREMLRAAVVRIADTLGYHEA